MPYYVFKQHGCAQHILLHLDALPQFMLSTASTACRYVVDIASIRGGRVPIDPESRQGQAGRNSAVRHFFKDGTCPLTASVCLALGRMVVSHHAFAGQINAGLLPDEFRLCAPRKPRATCTVSPGVQRMRRRGCSTRSPSRSSTLTATTPSSLQVCLPSGNAISVETSVNLRASVCESAGGHGIMWDGVANMGARRSLA